MPTKPVRGLVIFLPGSDGVADLHVIKSLESRTFDATIQHGLTDSLLRNHLGYAFFNYRGVNPLSDCIKGSSARERKEDFYANCWDNNRKAEVNFTRIRSDIIDALMLLKTSPRTKTAKTALLAFSEGGVHAAYLLRNGLIEADAVVGIGVPSVSVQLASKQQHTYALHFQRLMDAAKKNNGVLTEASLIAALPLEDANTLKMWREMLAPLPTSASRINSLQQQAWSAFDQYRYEFYRSDTTNTLPGVLYGRSVEVAASAEWIRDSLSETLDLGESLSTFRGRTIWLYGEFDNTAYNSQSLACGNKLPSHCRTITIKNGGHSLIDSPYVNTGQAIEIIVRSLLLTLR